MVGRPGLHVEMRRNPLTDREQARVEKGRLSLRSTLSSFLIVFSLAAAGCTLGGQDGLPLDEVATAPARYLGRNVRLRVTPMLSTAVRVDADGREVESSTASTWLCVLVLNPTRVTQGMLACVQDETPLRELASKSAAMQRIEGRMAAFRERALVAVMKERTGVDLITTPEGSPLFIELSAPLTSSSPSAPVVLPPHLRALSNPSPSASSTVAPTSPPTSAPIPTPGPTSSGGTP